MMARNIAYSEFGNDGGVAISVRSVRIEHEVLARTNGQDSKEDNGKLEHHCKRSVVDLKM